jgi:TRAP-type C4-dicarboxylate transport system permease small subunit
MSGYFVFQHRRQLSLSMCLFAILALLLFASAGGRAATPLIGRMREVGGWKQAWVY